MSQKLNAVVFGESGEGKSSFLNLISGSDLFKTGLGTTSITTEFPEPQEINIGDNNFRLYDTPSLNDNITVEQWHCGLKGRCQTVDTLFLIFKATSRMTASKLFAFKVLEQIFDEFRSENVVLVLTHCNEISDKEKLITLGVSVETICRGKLNWSGFSQIVLSDRSGKSMEEGRDVLRRRSPTTMTVRDQIDFAKIIHHARMFMGMDDCQLWCKQQQKLNRRTRRKQLFRLVFLLAGLAGTILLISLQPFRKCWNRFLGMLVWFRVLEESRKDHNCQS